LGYLKFVLIIEKFDPQNTPLARCGVFYFLCWLLRIDLFLFLPKSDLGRFCLTDAPLLAAGVDSF
jgi:hypothetical protein